MKCPHCGGEISLEQKYCPYCGKLNEAARRHAKDMEAYRDAYRQTETELRQKSQRFSAVWVRLVILAVMIILIIGTLILTNNVYSIRSDHLQRVAGKNAEEYSKILDDYLEQRDYLDFYAFTQARSIRPFSDEYRDYGNLYWAAGEYREVYSDLMNIVCGKNAGRNAGYLNEALETFYRFRSEDQWNEIKDSGKREKYRGYYQNMADDLNGLLKVYLKLSDEQVSKLPELSKAKRGVLLEEQAMSVYPEAFQEGQS